MEQEIVQPTATETPAAPVVRDSSEFLAGLSKPELSKWRATGELPDVAKPAEQAAEPVEPVAKTEPVVAQPERKLSKAQIDANERTRLAVERATSDVLRRAEAAEQRAKDLEARLAGTAPPETKPKTEDAARVIEPTDPEPKYDDFLDQPDPYAAHLRALARWDLKQEAKAEQQQTAQKQAAETFQQKYTTYAERMSAHAAATPDFAAKTEAVLAAIHPQSLFAHLLLESEVPHRLAEYLADPAVFNRLANLNPVAATRELARIEAKYEAEAGTSATAAAPVPPKTVSSAPQPARVLGERVAEPADESKAAVARGDFRAFRDAENRKLLAARTGK